MGIDPVNTEVATNVALMGGVGGVFALFLRWAASAFSMAKVENKSADAEVGVIEQLRQEVARLATIIQSQQKDIETMRRTQFDLEKRVMNQRAVLFAIETIVENMGECDDSSRKKLMKLIAIINDDESKEEGKPCQVCAVAEQQK